jgi:parvulin-like peptidyl-prolyl isomerase
MINKTLKISAIFYLLLNFSLTELKSEITNVIVAKVGNSVITSVDIENEIITNLLISGQEITQENINNSKNYALKKLINKTIKKNEITRYEVEDYSQKDLQNYTRSVAKKFATNTQGLKDIFKKNNVNFDSFVEKHEVELLWNTLIYRLYNSQININIIEVNNEISKKKDTENIEYNLSEIEILKPKYSQRVLEEILDAINSQDFETAAKKFSIAASGKSGGLVGWVSGKSLSSKYLNQIKNLNIKEVSSPIFNENSVSLFKLNEIKKNKIEFDELKKNILRQKSDQKLNLFSRSHFSNLESTTLITIE